MCLGSNSAMVTPLFALDIDNLPRDDQQGYMPYEIQQSNFQG